MKNLFLEDLKNLTEEQVRAHLQSQYDAPKERLESFDILIAYESVGDYGCDSSSFFLFRDKETNELFENHGSHCSCYGFEGQFSPEKTDINYLKSDKFNLSTGGYDNNQDVNKKEVKYFISLL